MAVGCQPIAEMPKAATHPPLLAHRVPCLFINKHLLQSGDDGWVLYFCRLATGTRKAYAVGFPPAPGPCFGSEVGLRASGCSIQELQFVEAGRNSPGCQSCRR